MTCPQVVEQLRWKAAHASGVGFVKVVVPPDPHARLEDVLGLTGGVPHVKKLVDEFLEYPRSEAHTGSHDRCPLERACNAQEDGGRGDNRISAVWAELPGVTPLPVGHRAHFLEERTRSGH